MLFSQKVFPFAFKWWHKQVLKTEFKLLEFFKKFEILSKGREFCRSLFSFLISLLSKRRREMRRKGPHTFLSQNTQRKEMVSSTALPSTRNVHPGRAHGSNSLWCFGFWMLCQNQKLTLLAQIKCPGMWGWAVTLCTLLFYSLCLRKWWEEGLAGGTGAGSVWIQAEQNHGCWMFRALIKPIQDGLGGKGPWSSHFTAPGCSPVMREEMEKIFDVENKPRPRFSGLFCA